MRLEMLLLAALVASFSVEEDECSANFRRTEVSAGTGEYVTVIDNFLGSEDAEEAAKRAKRAEYAPFHPDHKQEYENIKSRGNRLFAPRTPRAVFPGVAARVDTWYAEKLKSALEKRGIEGGNSSWGVDKTAAFWGLVCYAPKSLSHEQRAPHVDRDAKTNPQRALVHYLSKSRSDWGGTGFYRERQSQTSLFRDLSVDSYFLTGSATYNCSLNSRRAFDAHCRSSSKSSIDRRGRPFYQAKSDDEFELLHVVPFQFDRAVIYDAMQLHSAYIETSARLSCDPEHGRLAASVFLF